MENIKFHKAREKGKGLPFGIIYSKELLFNSDDLFRPSLRDFHVILWFKKGTGKYFVDFKEYQFEPNTITLIAKDQLHYLVPPPPKDLEIVSIPFKSDFIYRNDTDLQHLFNFKISDHIEGQQILKLKPSDTDFLNNIKEHMQVVYHEWNGKSRENAFYHWLCIFLIYCEKQQEKFSERAEIAVGSDTKTLLHLDQLLEANFRTKFKVQFYVDHLNITLKTLSKITKKRYKLSPKQVIDERRILEIKRLLRGSDESIKEIAYHLNFDEPTNLVKYFKKHTAQTPQVFRTNG